MKGILPEVSELWAQCSSINRQILAQAQPNVELAQTIRENT